MNLESIRINSYMQGNISNDTVMLSLSDLFQIWIVSQPKCAKQQALQRPSTNGIYFGRLFLANNSNFLKKYILPIVVL